MQETEKLIEGLGLTKREERELRHVVGLGYPKPKTRFDRLLYSPMKEVDVVIALVVLLALVAALFYGVWKLSSHLRSFNEFVTALVVPLLVLSLVLEKRRRDELVRKLYRALEREEASKVPANPELPANQGT